MRYYQRCRIAAYVTATSQSLYSCSLFIQNYPDPVAHRQLLELPVYAGSLHMSWRKSNVNYYISHKYA